jgi:hypothetical protein
MPAIATKTTETTTETLPMYLPPGREETVELATLNIDKLYQRGERRGVKAIAANFNPMAAGVLYAARRHNGTLWVVDGQQRLAAMTILNITHWKVHVFNSTGPEQEAAVFTILNGNRKHLTGLELFHARLAAGDETARGVMQAMEDYGYKIGCNDRSHSPDNVSAIGTIYQVASRKDGVDIVRRAFCLIRRCWPGCHEATQSIFLRGLLTFLSLAENVKEELLVRRMTAVPVQKIMQDARSRTGCGLSKAISRVIAEHYNKRLLGKSRITLPE